MAVRGIRGRGALESEVLALVAAADAPMTAAQVQVALDADLAYTTVMTTLSRLHAKGALERWLVGRAYEYSMIGTAERARSNMAAHQMLRLLDTEADRTGVLTRFVAELGVEDGRLLAQLLRADGPGDDDAAPRRDHGHGHGEHT